MSARRKLNTAYFSGSLLIAAAVGAATESWLIFALTLVGLLASNFYLGEIRPPRCR